MINPFVWFAAGLAAATMAILWIWSATQAPKCDQCGGPMARSRRGIFKRRYLCAAGHKDERLTWFGRLFG